MKTLTTHDKKDFLKDASRPKAALSKTTEIPLSVYLFLLIAFLTGIQAFATYKTTRNVNRIASELGVLQTDQLTLEKSKQEVMDLRIKNESQGLFISSLFSAVGPLATTLVALMGTFLGLRNYFDTRKKDRLERAAGDLKDLLIHTADDNARLRIVGVVGLQHFFMPEKKEYHLQALSSLVAMARLEKNEEVLRNIKIAVEKAVQNLDLDTLAQVTWQGVSLKNVIFSDRDLSGLDFRDAVLDDADFSRCVLNRCRFVNARLNGACFQDASLMGADLTYADLAGANLENANLRNAIMKQARVLRMNIRNANLRGSLFDLDKLPWPLVHGWRDAFFDEGVKETLIGIHGPAPSGIKVLMLMWEVTPFVAGGTWTAAFHLVRNLKKRGVRLTVIVPWDEEAIMPNPFNCGVEVVTMGIQLMARETASPYQRPWSPYGSAGGVYGNGCSPYGQGLSPYARVTDSFQTKKGTGILRLMEEFKRRVVSFCRHEEFDIIHAHDWVTFSAAEAASELKNKPWIAHFHSTEQERRPSAMDPVLARMEQKGAERAAWVVAPSRTTAEVIASCYGVKKDRIAVMPNPLSDEEISPVDMGNFESRSVVFTGRITEQKRPDLFMRIADRLSSLMPAIRFRIFGSGELQSLFPIYSGQYELKGQLPWERRGEAYRNAGAVLVTSRAEPFGMVILEAMQHHVPVFYPAAAGAAEVLSSGITIDPENIDATVDAIKTLMENWELWESVVEQQVEEIRAYKDRGYERQITSLWDRVHDTFQRKETVEGVS